MTKVSQVSNLAKFLRKPENRTTIFIVNLDRTSSSKSCFDVDIFCTSNPISESGRLWTLGICSSLRRLTLIGTAAADLPQYRSQVASVLPMLVYLDDRPLHTDVECKIIEWHRSRNEL